MQPIKLAALRDFALAHLPRAQAVPKGPASDQYNITLYGIAALTSSTAPAVQQAAATLLQSVMSLSIQWDADGKLTPAQRQQAERQTIEAATELCTLTCTVIPWLADALTIPAPAPEPLPAATPIVSFSQQITRPPPGINLDTATAAALLGVQPQTMRSWASKDDGPLQCIKGGRANLWPSDDVIRLMDEGWQSRKRKV